MQPVGIRGIAGKFQLVRVHEGRVSGFTAPRQPIVYYLDDWSDPLGDLVCQPSYDKSFSTTYEEYSRRAEKGYGPAKVYGSPGLIEHCWFEPIAIVDEAGKRIGIFYIESFDDSPKRVFQVLEPKVGKAAPLFANIVPEYFYRTTSPDKHDRDMFKSLRRLEGKELREIAGAADFYDSPIRCKWSEKNGLVVHFPGFKVRETLLRPVLWKFKRAGVNEVPLKLLAQGINRETNN